MLDLKGQISNVSKRAKILALVELAQLEEKAAA